MHQPEDAENAEVAAALRVFLLYILLPAWMLPGFADYLCHRATKIEQTSGTHESLTHILMISSTGAGIALGLLCEINEMAILAMAASALAHEAVVLWDVGYASKLRPPTPTEQHIHSFLEVLPFTALAFTCCLYPKRVATLLGLRPQKPDFRLRPKRHPEAPVFLAALATLGTVLLAVPFAEEFARCFRVDHTVLPRKT